ncbi:MAG: orotate phosphoribosyltransferase [Saprospirales bacterium]|nr:MAG: orotate phosphoribosyltransferase [Saprospirales bacterium]
MSSKAHKVAQYLLNADAVKLNPENPFTWASGISAPIYCDNRRILSYPDERSKIKNLLADTAKKSFPETEIIAGVATAGIPHGVLLADCMDLPFIYVRSGAKGHGMKSRIEGRVIPGKKVLVVEDLVSTGMSCLDAVQALRKAGFAVEGVIALFTYQLDEAAENFDRENCRLVTLSDYGTLIDVALQSKKIREEDLESLREWRKSPKNWKK